jgi:hypothetical protein
MRLMGVTELQGFFFSKAVPAGQVDALVAAFNAEPQTAAPATIADLRGQRRG